MAKNTRQPAELTYPGVYVDEVNGGVRPISGVSTSTTAFVGSTRSGPIDKPVYITSFADFEQRFGGLWIESRLGYAIRDFFLNGGTQSVVVRVNKSKSIVALRKADFIGPGKKAANRGLFALTKAEVFNLLCIPPYNRQGNVDASVIAAAANFCENRRAFLLVDPPSGWTNKDLAKNGVAALGTKSKNAAVFFPRLRAPNPLNGQVEEFAPSGAVAGVYARTDAQQGVWKAPADKAATLAGNAEPIVALSANEIAELSRRGINCLRRVPTVGTVIWGARTLQGDDRVASEWKYAPVRRFALFIEESLYRGTQWTVFEPNDESLWAKLRLSIGNFMHGLFRQGTFQGRTPREAFFVKCDRTTMTQADIDGGVVNILVGFAPLKPAEFVVVKIQAMAKKTSD